MRVVAAVLLVALLVKEGAAIANHGIAGWLRGDGQNQSIDEVRATVLLLIFLLFVVVALSSRVGVTIVSTWRDWRLVRAIRRERSQSPMSSTTQKPE